MKANRASNDAPTNPDDIPPVHVLVAAQEQDRKETENLLAGFDKPGREPKRPRPSRDFVDYYARKKGDSTAKGAAAAAKESDKRDGGERQAPTVIVRRGELPVRRRSSPWAAWAAVGALMLLVGGAVAFVATGDGDREASPTAPGPSAATTITSVAAPTEPTTRPTDVPPPDPKQVATASPTVIAATPEPAAPAPAPRPSQAASARRASAPPSRPESTDVASTDDAPRPHKPPPRDDFIRDL